MSLSDPLSITYNAVATNLNRVNQDNYGAVYYGESAAGERLTFTVKHTIPARGASGESHLARLDVEQYTAGVLTRTSSVWMAFRASDAVQDQESMEDAAEALVAALTVANITKLVSRQS
jgi:hypothetical protein